MSSRSYEVPQAEFTWRAREVVRVVDHRPHLVVRIAVAGGFFPHRASVPFMHIVQGREVVARSWFAEIGDDNRSLLGYFATDIPNGAIEVGYQDEPPSRVTTEFEAAEVKRLDRQRLDKEVIEASVEYLREKRGF